MRPENILEHIITSVSTESYLQINETNKNENSSDIFLLNLGKFQDENLTLNGNINFTQDLFLFENTDKIGIRLRYQEKKSLNQYNYGVEKRHLIERSTRLRLNLLQDISNQTDFVSTSDIFYSPGTDNRSYELNGISLFTNFSYRFDRNIELGFKIGAGSKTDKFQNINSYDNTQSVRVIYSMISKGNLQFEFERSEILMDNTPQYIPYNLTDGKVVGKNWLWKINFDYQINSFLQATLFYFGRIEKSENAIHNATLNVKLFF